MVSTKRKRTPSPQTVAIEQLTPVLKPLLEPVVEPVLERLDRHEELLAELRSALDTQFKRTAAIQAQLDQVLAALSKIRS